MRMIKDKVLTAEHWTLINRLMKRWFNLESTKRQYADFVNYCEAGVVVNGVKPILNPINLYASLAGITSEEAIKKLFKKGEQKHDG